MVSALEQDPPNLSFTMRGNNNNNKLIDLLRTFSSKSEPPLSNQNDTVCVSPALSATSFSLHHLPSSSSTLSFIPKHDVVEPAASHCIYSVLKKGGQILCIAAAEGLMYSGSQSGVIRVWKQPEFEECGQLKAKACVVVAIQVTQDRVYGAYGDCRIRVWRREVDGGVVKHVRIATVPSTGSFIRSYISGKKKMIKHLGPISSLAINTSDDILYSASLDKTVKVWRISDFKCIETIRAHPDPINAVVVTQNGVLYTASDDATIRVWKQIYCDGPHILTVSLPTKHSPVKTLALNLDGVVLYGGCSDGYVQYWVKGDVLEELGYGGELSGHTHAVMCLSSVANYVVSGSADGTGRVWVRETDGQHTCIAVLQGHMGPIMCVSVAILFECVPDESAKEGCIVYTGSLDGVLKVWRVQNTTGQSRDCELNSIEHFI